MKKRIVYALFVAWIALASSYAVAAVAGGARHALPSQSVAAVAVDALAGPGVGAANLGTRYTGCGGGQRCYGQWSLQGTSENVHACASHESYNPYTGQYSYWTSCGDTGGTPGGRDSRGVFFYPSSPYGAVYDRIYAITAWDNYGTAWWEYAGPF